MSDTHVPARARDLPAALWEELDRADAVLHAGDWVDVRLLDAMETALAPRGVPLVGVAGNNDGHTTTRPTDHHATVPEALSHPITTFSDLRHIAFILILMYKK